VAIPPKNPTFFFNIRAAYIIGIANIHAVMRKVSFRSVSYDADVSSAMTQAETNEPAVTGTAGS
jgi:hypothetical protein